MLNTYASFYHRGYLYAKLGWCATTGHLLMFSVAKVRNYLESTKFFGIFFAHKNAFFLEEDFSKKKAIYQKFLIFLRFLFQRFTYSSILLFLYFLHKFLITFFFLLAKVRIYLQEGGNEEGDDAASHYDDEEHTVAHHVFQIT